MEQRISVGIFRPKWVDHLQRWSRIFRSKETETDLGYTSSPGPAAIQRPGYWAYNNYPDKGHKKWLLPMLCRVLRLFASLLFHFQQHKTPKPMWKQGTLYFFVFSKQMYVKFAIVLMQDCVKHTKFTKFSQSSGPFVFVFTHNSF